MTAKDLAEIFSDLFNKHEVFLSGDMYDEIYQLLTSSLEEAKREERGYWQEFIRLNFKEGYEEGKKLLADYAS